MMLMRNLEGDDRSGLTVMLNDAESVLDSAIQFMEILPILAITNFPIL